MCRRRSVLVATHARQHPPEAEPQCGDGNPDRPVRPATVGNPVIRKVDSSRNISFAAVVYRVSNVDKRQQVKPEWSATLSRSQEASSTKPMPSNTTRSKPTGLQQPWSQTQPDQCRQLAEVAMANESTCHS